MSQPSYKIFSFYNSKVNPEVPRFQRAVFSYFGYTIHHVKNEGFTHGDFLNHICQTETSCDILIFFDIDCIPTRKNWVNKLIQQLSVPDTVAGAAQTANHLRDGKNLYVSPFFFGVTTAYLKKLDYPDMEMNEDMDAGQNLTETALKEGGNIQYWWPTSIEEEQWSLYHPVHQKFGFGTTYDDLVYHAFLSRFDLAQRFVRKCKDVLPWWLKLKMKLQRKLQGS